MRLVDKPVPHRFVQETCHWLTCGVMYRSSHPLDCSLPLPPVLHKFLAKKITQVQTIWIRCHSLSLKSDSSFALPLMYKFTWCSHVLYMLFCYETMARSPCNILSFGLMTWTTGRQWLQLKTRQSFLATMTPQRRSTIHKFPPSCLQQDRRTYQQDCQKNSTTIIWR
jgi:hypothetical protein